MNTNKCFQCLSNKYNKFVQHTHPILRLHLLSTSTNKTILRCSSKKSLATCLKTSQSYLNMRLYSNVPKAEQTTVNSSNAIHNIKPLIFDNISLSPSVPHEELLENLKRCKTIEQQMKTLVTTMCLTEDDIQKRIHFCKKFEAFFQPFFNKFKIQLFGSSVNGFGFKGCDMDMTFETASDVKEMYHLEPPDIPLVEEVLSGKVTPQELSELPPKEQLLFIHTVLLDYYNESELPTIFINAFVPLVRFYHDKYKLKCDLTFENKVAFANTKLLYLFGKYDSRVKPLIMTIRYWAKHVELIGKGAVFNTYTISLMLVYFLQTRNPPVLPSAQHILSLSDKFEVGDMSDNSFLEILSIIPPSENTQTLDELLREFFFFYLYFDFTRVICPLTALSVPREDFFSKAENRKFRMSTICVQDPLLPSHNVAEFADYKICKKLCTELLVTCKMYQDNNAFSHSELAPWGLMCLFDKPFSYSLQNVSQQKAISFSIPIASIQPDMLASSSEAIFRILKDVLMFECSILTKDEVMCLLEIQDDLVISQKEAYDKIIEDRSQLSTLKKRRKWVPKTSESDSTSDALNTPVESILEQFKKCTEKHKLILCSKCIVYKNTWLGRDLVMLETPHSHDALEKEHLISLQVAKQNEMNVFDKKVKPFVFLYECYVESKDQHGPSLLINFRPLQRMSFNAILGTFLKEYIPMVMKNM